MTEPGLPGQHGPGDDYDFLGRGEPEGRISPTPGPPYALLWDTLTGTPVLAVLAQACASRSPNEIAHLERGKSHAGRP